MPFPQRGWAIATIALGLTMAVLDGVIANVALPTIAKDLNVEPAFSIWIVNCYQLAITVSVLPLSALGDIIGYRKVYMCGLVLFTLASIACALSDSLLTLTAARALQGFGAAGIISVNLALVRYTYPQHFLGRAIGLNAIIVALAASLGPTLSAAILSVADWPWIFAINAPLGLLTLALGWRSLPFSPRGTQQFDGLSAGLCAATIGLLIISIDLLGHGGKISFFLISLLSVMGLGYWLVRRQFTQPNPMLPLDLLRIPIFTLSIATSFAAFVGQMLAMVSLPFLLQLDLHFSAIETGFLMTPWPIGVGIAAPIAGWLADRYPAGLLGGIGLAGFAAGLLALAFLPAEPSYFDIIWPMALTGIGFGFFQAPNNRAMISAAPRERSGGASGMLGTARLLGQTVGAAILSMLLAQRPEDGTIWALWFSAGFAVLASFVSVARLFDEPPDERGKHAPNPEADAAMHADLLRQRAQKKAL